MSGHGRLPHLQELEDELDGGHREARQQDGGGDPLDPLDQALGAGKEPGIKPIKTDEPSSYY